MHPKALILGLNILLILLILSKKKTSCQLLSLVGLNLVVHVFELDSGLAEHLL